MDDVESRLGGFAEVADQFGQQVFQFLPLKSDSLDGGSVEITAFRTIVPHKAVGIPFLGPASRHLDGRFHTRLIWLYRRFHNRFRFMVSMNPAFRLCREDSPGIGCRTSLR